MRILLSLNLILLANAAYAHPGHWAELAGHDHWVAGAAIGLAIALGLRGALKGRTKDPEPEAEPDTESEEQPA